MVAPNPDRAEPVEALSFSLVPHPATPPASNLAVQARIKVADGLAWLTYEITPGANLRLPAQILPNRSHELWEKTCMELFVTDVAGTAYREYNFSPSREWAAYRFSSYRNEPAELAMRRPPAIGTVRSEATFLLFAVLEGPALRSGVRIALSAVIEETGGTKSYWALAHPPGVPDFHHPTCFAATLAAPGVA